MILIIDSVSIHHTIIFQKSVSSRFEEKVKNIQKSLER